ncbi:hypothetical protein KFK14_13010 [Sphingobium phenoxybenzoativorans]|uniref:Uncharacterized protein n=1 Tax=Sphingobium phenoxybenzoativorans TaxID=1592790 RepID=A0A975K3W4_9SPHN|nr:hypothetical protein [Sphingobium phenoxybenzoativorans]QUT04067.1 hypothetical protein KFK14_13010 [Sphingobium phenoxybenzoativorans]
MAGLGYIVGGALQGLGSGLAKQAELDITSRRDAALEALRTQNRRDEATLTADLTDRNNARSTQRDTDKQIAIGKAATDNQIIVDDHKTTNDIKLKKIDFNNSQSMARLNSALSQQNDAASQMLRRKLESGEIAQTFEADDGQIWGLSKTGERKPTGVYFNPKPTKSDPLAGLSMDDDEDGKPAAPAPRTRPAGGEAPPTKPAAQGGSKPQAKVYTASEVREAAKAMGWTEDQVRQWAKANGYKLSVK